MSFYPLLYLLFLIYQVLMFCQSPATIISNLCQKNNFSVSQWEINKVFGTINLKFKMYSCEKRATPPPPFTQRFLYSAFINEALKAINKFKSLLKIFKKFSNKPEIENTSFD